MVVWDLGKELTTTELKGTFWDNGNVLYLGCGDGYMTYNFVKFIEMYIKKVYFTICKFYFSKSKKIIMNTISAKNKLGQNKF